MRYFKTHLQAIIMLMMTILGVSVEAAETRTAYVNVPAKTTYQNIEDLKKHVSEFLTIQTQGYPGHVEIQPGDIDPRLKLSECADVNVFLPRGSRPWGRTSVGVSCASPVRWTIYVQANVSVSAQYLVAAVPLAQGQVLTEKEVLFETGDLTRLPAGVFTDKSQIIGKLANISMNAGTVLRQEQLKSLPVVQQGQSVMLITQGKGFSISAEGNSLNKANEGQLVQVRVASGQVVSGIARSDGKVQVNY